jgi:hypothetical protein
MSALNEEFQTTSKLFFLQRRPLGFKNSSQNLELIANKVLAIKRSLGTFFLSTVELLPNFFFLLQEVDQKKILKSEEKCHKNFQTMSQPDPELRPKNKPQPQP